MPITPLVFTGVSSFSSDLQSILTRAQQIAALPLQALQQDKQNQLDRQAALETLQSHVQQISQSLSSLAQLSGANGMATVSDSSKVNVLQTGEVEPGRHIITDVTQLATATVVASATGYATTDQTSVTGGSNYLELWVGSEKLVWNLTPEDDNLSAVRDWINGSQLGVTASVISADSGYVLSVTADSPGVKTISLYTGVDKSGTNLLTSIVNGTNLQFKIDGQLVERSSNIVTDVIPGLSLSFTESTDAGEEISLATQRSADPIAYSLQMLGSQYNLFQAELATHSGKAGGILTGDMAVTQLRAAMTSLGSLATLDGTGLSFDENGVMQFDGTVVSALDATGLQALVQQISDEEGVFAQLEQQWAGLSDGTYGLIAGEVRVLVSANSRLTAQMEELSERINASQAVLQARLQAADTLLAMLQSQQNLLTASLDSLSYVAFGKTTTKNSI